VKFEELNIDTIQEYEEYYPNFNITVPNSRDTLRRRLTRFT
jgi:hypothetical protein